jgi:transporter family protein
MNNPPWWLWAVASALCAAVIPILSKYGLRSASPETATIVRSVATTLVLLLFGAVTNLWSSVAALGQGGARGVTCLVLAGVAGAASWICYFKALAAGDVSKVAPLDKLSVPLAILFSVVLLGERPSVLNWIGIALAFVGIVLATLPSS